MFPQVLLGRLFKPYFLPFLRGIKMNILEKFIKQINARSNENQNAFNLLYEKKCYGVCIGIIRQELDSLLRASYLIDSNGYDFRFNAFDLIKNSVEIGEWKFLNDNHKMQSVRDREMLSEGGWEEVVYNFGCGLIHLSDKHLYRDFDPIIKLSVKEKGNIIGYLKKYHEYDKEAVNMGDIINYLPKIYQKIYESIEYYLKLYAEINDVQKIF